MSYCLGGLCTVNFGVLLIIFFIYIFSSACEFQFIERIGAHGKQNSGFIIIIIIIIIIIFTLPIKIKCLKFIVLVYKVPHNSSQLHFQSNGSSR